MNCKVTLSFIADNGTGGLGFGRGIVTLLEGVEKYGSINQATRSMGMAYSKAWKIIKKTEEEFGVRLVDREGAHGSALTDEARALIGLYHDAAAAAQNAAAAVFEQKRAVMGF
jgi:molybdate transport system regulatory protein